ncbi:superkiller, partial [Linnemannia gamsii]
MFLHIAWVVLWDLQCSERGRIIARHGAFELNSGLCMAFSPDGRQLALGHEGCNIDLFDLQSGRILKSVNFGTSATLGISTLAYSPNGKQIAVGGGAAARVYLWDLLSDEPQARLECSDTINGVNCLSYSSCGHWIASVVGNAGVQIWRRQPEEAENWSLVSVYNRFFDIVNSIDWNPRGSLEFVTGCRDSSVRVWRIQVDEEGVKVLLVWATGFGQLCVLDSTFKDAT